MALLSHNDLNEVFLIGSHLFVIAHILPYHDLGSLARWIALNVAPVDFLRIGSAATSTCIVIGMVSFRFEVSVARACLCRENVVTFRQAWHDLQNL